MDQQRKNILIICAIGMFSVFMPWVHAPIVGSLSGSQGDGWFVFGFFAIAAVIAYYKDNTKPLSGNRIRDINAMGALAIMFGVWKLLTITSITSDPSLEGNPFAEMLDMSVSVGIGLYLVILAGLALPIYNYSSKKKNQHISK